MIKKYSQWCAGCGNFVILSALKKTLEELEINLDDVVIVSGIGCSGKFPHYLDLFSAEGLHGRALPLATGIKLGNKNLKVIVIGGDGDGYGIGLNHLIHSLRKNIDLTYIVVNNETYSLTKGQASPTTKIGEKRILSSKGVQDFPINPLNIALMSNGTFFARGSSVDIIQLKNILKNAIEHKGFSFVDVITGCINYYPDRKVTWFKERIRDIKEVKNYDIENKGYLFDFLKNFDINSEKYYTGIYYQEKREVLESKKDLSKLNLNVDKNNKFNAFLERI